MWIAKLNNGQAFEEETTGELSLAIAEACLPYRSDIPGVRSLTWSDDHHDLAVDAKALSDFQDWCQEKLSRLERGSQSEVEHTELESAAIRSQWL